MPKSTPSGPDLNPQEQASLVQMGKLMGDPRDDFDREVEKHLQRMGETSAKKMHAAQTSGGAEGLGPSGMARAAVQSRDAAQQQSAAQGEVKAAQAQGAQAPVNAPAAPSGPEGVSEPYQAQAGPQPPPSAAQGPPQPEEEEGGPPPAPGA